MLVIDFFSSFEKYFFIRLLIWPLFEIFDSGQISKAELAAYFDKVPDGWHSWSTVQPTLVLDHTQQTFGYLSLGFREQEIRDKFAIFRAVFQFFFCGFWAINRMMTKLIIKKKKVIWRKLKFPREGFFYFCYW